MGIPAIRIVTKAKRLPQETKLLADCAGKLSLGELTRLNLKNLEVKAANRDLQQAKLEIALRG